MDSQKPLVVVFGQFPPYPDSAMTPQKNANVFLSLFPQQPAQQTPGQPIQAPSPLPLPSAPSQSSVQDLQTVEKTIEIKPIIKVERPIYIDLPLEQPILRYTQSSPKPAEELQKQAPSLQKQEIVQDHASQPGVEEKVVKGEIPIEPAKGVSFELPQINLSDLCLEWRYVSLLSLTGVIFLMGRRLGWRGARIAGVSGLLLSYPMVPELKQIMKWKMHFLKRRMRCGQGRRWKKSRKYAGSYF